MDKKYIYDLIVDGSSQDIYTFIDRYFNDDREKFIEFCYKKGLFDYKEISDFFDDEFGHTLLRYRYKDNPDKTKEFIINTYFNDLDKKDDRYYLTMGREDFASLFEDNGSDTTSYNIAKAVLSDEYWQRYSDVVYDGSVFSNYLEELTKKNYNDLLKYICEENCGQDITLDGEEFVITENFLNELSVDKLSDLIWDDEFGEDLKYSLMNLFEDSYNSALESEYYNKVMEGLKDLFKCDNYGDWVTRTYKTYEDKTKTIEEYSFEVTNIIDDVITSGLNVLENSYSFDYYGSFLSILEALMGDEYTFKKIEISIPYYDYPDHKMVSEYINDGFGDFI